MRVPRFRLRTLMTAVAIAAVFLALAAELARLRRISERHRMRAMSLALDEANLHNLVAGQLGLREGVAAHYRLAKAGGPATHHNALLGTKLDDLPAEVKRLCRRFDRVAALRRKYERAASRPWETVPPDPPEPR